MRPERSGTAKAAQKGRHHRDDSGRRTSSHTHGPHMEGGRWRPGATEAGLMIRLLAGRSGAGGGGSCTHCRAVVESSRAAANVCACDAVE